MKKQVLFIHGGQVYDNYETYLKDLHSFLVDPTVEKKKWKLTLSESLGQDYEVFLPQMPNPMNAHYAEWEIWFLKHVPYLRDDVIFIGHSLGGSFFLKFLSENELPISVKALYLVSAPFFSSSQHEGGDFRFDEQKLNNMTSNISKLTLFHSLDDEVVPIHDFELFKPFFKKAQYMVFPDRGHFNQPTFPELIEDIKNLS